MSPTVYRLLNDLQRLAADMQTRDRAHQLQWHRVAIDSAAILRLVVAATEKKESAALAALDDAIGSGFSPARRVRP